MPAHRESFNRFHSIINQIRAGFNSPQDVCAVGPQPLEEIARVNGIRYAIMDFNDQLRFNASLKGHISLTIEAMKRNNDLSPCGEVLTRIGDRGYIVQENEEFALGFSHEGMTFYTKKHERNIEQVHGDSQVQYREQDLRRMYMDQLVRLFPHITGQELVFEVLKSFALIEDGGYSSHAS
jgi:hypothetical protein